MARGSLLGGVCYLGSKSFCLGYRSGGREDRLPRESAFPGMGLDKANQTVRLLWGFQDEPSTQRDHQPTSFVTRFGSFAGAGLLSG